jgi:predicted AAA+ superfamily ATPase
LFFKDIPETGIFARLKKAVSLDTVTVGYTREMIYDAAADMILEAEKHSIRGDLWEIFYALAVAEDDNHICRAFERTSTPDAVLRIISSEVWTHHKLISAVKHIVESEGTYADLRALSNYVPSGEGGALPAKEAYEDVTRLAQSIASAVSPEDMAPHLRDFFTARGSGRFAVDYAFRWNQRLRDLVPIRDIDPITFDSLIGYEPQKSELLANTESFISGRPSNNVLLFGDSGTGKSSSVRALLNEPGFVRGRLRMIEAQQGQFADIPDILDMIRGSGYRFILFMDDLSFEEFEVEYKHLKAIIEGGLERKPDNVVIYATSNRRNIIREVWSDRASSVDDVHGWDTMQEKHSLSDRFGLTIWYPSVGKDEYMSIVRSIAREFGLVIKDSEMETSALRWELERGGFTGRTARQFVYHMLQQES